MSDVRSIFTVGDKQNSKPSPFVCSILLANIIYAVGYPAYVRASTSTVFYKFMCAPRINFNVYVYALIVVGKFSYCILYSYNRPQGSNCYVFSF
jgi:hypothetical protein